MRNVYAKTTRQNHRSQAIQLYYKFKYVTQCVSCDLGLCVMRVYVHVCVMSMCTFMCNAYVCSRTDVCSCMSWYVNKHVRNK